MIRIITVTVAAPRPAVHEQHHWHRLVRNAVAVLVAAGRQREIGDFRQAVAGFDFQRMHRRQRCADKFGSRDIELLQRLGLAVIEIKRRWGGHGIDADRPQIVGIGARRNADFAFQVLLQEFEIALYRGIDRGPLGLQIGDRKGFHLAGFRIGQRAADVGFVALGDHGGLAARHVLGDQHRLVAAARVDPVQRLAVGGEAGR